MSQQPNSMPAGWCARAVADARRWVDTAPQGEARTHVIELLSQLDRPPTADLAGLQQAAQRLIHPDGGPSSRRGASDARWREYRKLATPANILALVSRFSTVEAANTSLKQELAEQEKEKLELVQELDVLRENGGAFYSRVFQAGTLSADEGEAYQWASDYPGYPTRLAGIIKRLLDLPLPAPSPPLEAAVPAAELLNQLPGCPAAKCHGCGLPSHAARCRVVDCPAKAPDWFSPLVFSSAAEYDASVQSVVERIKGGEVQPREPDEEEEVCKCSVAIWQTDVMGQQWCSRCNLLAE